MKRFWYEMLVANVVMVLALIASCLIYVIFTGLVGWHEFRTREKRSKANFGQCGFNEDSAVADKKRAKKN